MSGQCAHSRDVKTTIKEAAFGASSLTLSRDCIKQESSKQVQTQHEDHHCFCPFRRCCQRLLRQQIQQRCHWVNNILKKIIHYRVTNLTFLYSLVSTASLTVVSLVKTILEESWLTSTAKANAAFALFATLPLTQLFPDAPTARMELKPASTLATRARRFALPAPQNVASKIFAQ